MSYMGETPRDLYVHRMRNCRPFKFFGITPEWMPGEGDIEGFIHDEVVRQFHDTRVRDDGGVRQEWMLAAWQYAQRNAGVFPDVEDILRLGCLIEPKVNSPAGPRTVDVYIDGERCAPPGTLPKLLPLLVAQAPNMEKVQELSPEGRKNWRALWRYGQPESLIVEAFAEDVKWLRTVDDWYIAFESIHPFGDGNGRTGKILHNWLLGTLDEPVLVDDYFGGNNP